MDTAVAYQLARRTRHHPADIDIETFARTLGLGGSCSKLWAALELLAGFGAAHFYSADILAIRRELPGLTERHLDRLLADMASAYRHPSHR